MAGHPSGDSLHCWPGGPRLPYLQQAARPAPNRFRGETNGTMHVQSLRPLGEHQRPRVEGRR